MLFKHIATIQCKIKAHWSRIKEQIPRKHSAYSCWSSVISGGKKNLKILQGPTRMWPTIRRISERATRPLINSWATLWAMVSGASQRAEVRKSTRQKQLDKPAPSYPSPTQLDTACSTSLKIGGRKSCHSGFSLLSNMPINFKADGEKKKRKKKRGEWVGGRDIY